MKAIVITGVARCMGFAFGRALAEKGNKVVLTYIAPFPGEAQSLENIAAQKLDVNVTNISDIKEAAGKIDETYDGIDVLINNAAIFQMAPI